MQFGSMASTKLITVASIVCMFYKLKNNIFIFIKQGKKPSKHN